MIIDKFFSTFFEIISWLFDYIPEIDLTALLDANFEPVFQYVKFISYLLPMQTVLIIIELNVAIVMFKIVISSLKTLWGILPLL